MVFEIKVPEAGFSVTEGKVVAWHRSAGDKVVAGEPVVSVETEKITVEVPAEASGVLKEIRVNVGEVAPVGGVLGVILTETDAAAPAGAAQAVPRGAAFPAFVYNEERGLSSITPAAGTGRHPAKKRRISPLAKALARKNGIELSALAAGVAAGSGPEGRIVKEDLEQFLKTAQASSEAAAAASRSGAPMPPSKAGAQTAPQPSAAYGVKVPYAGWRKIVADRMVAAVRSAPHYTMTVDIDVTELSALVQSARERIERPKITYLPFVMKACAGGIDAVPEVNAYCFEDGYAIQKEVNVGVAVDLGEKLLVPVIKGVREKPILQLAEELEGLVQKARSEKLEAKDIEGGTITITNVGAYGIHSGTSILFQPQSTIVYMGAVREEPAVVGGRIVIRKRMMFGGTFDHRLVNGGPGARFLREVKENLERLASFVLNLR